MRGTPIVFGLVLLTLTFFQTKESSARYYTYYQSYPAYLYQPYFGYGNWYHAIPSYWYSHNGYYYPRVSYFRREPSYNVYSHILNETSQTTNNTPTQTYSHSLQQPAQTYRPTTSNRRNRQSVVRRIANDPIEHKQEEKPVQAPVDAILLGQPNPGFARTYYKVETDQQKFYSPKALNVVRNELHILKPLFERWTQTYSKFKAKLPKELPAEERHEKALREAFNTTYIQRSNEESGATNRLIDGIAELFDRRLMVRDKNKAVEFSLQEITSDAHPTELYTSVVPIGKDKISITARRYDKTFYSIVIDLNDGHLRFVKHPQFRRHIKKWGLDWSWMTRTL